MKQRFTQFPHDDGEPDHDRTSANAAGADQVACLSRYGAASTRFAFDCQVKQRSVAKPPLPIFCGACYVTFRSAPLCS